MAIKKVIIEEGCTACGMCEAFCPEVFSVQDTAVVIEGVNVSDYEENVKQAEENCPVNVIKTE